MSVTKISLVQWLITNLNVILYLSTCHTVYIGVLIPFMIMPQLIINTYVSLTYELKKKLETYVWVNLLGPGPRLIKKRIYRATVSQRLRNTVLGVVRFLLSILSCCADFFDTYTNMADTGNVFINLDKHFLMLHFHTGRQFTHKYTSYNLLVPLHTARVFVKNTG